MNFGRLPSRVEVGEQLLEQVDPHPVVVHLDLAGVGLVGAEDRDRARVGRALGDDDVAGVDQRLADQIERLLAAGGDDDVLGVGAHVLGPPSPPRSPPCVSAKPSVGPYCSAFALDSCAIRVICAANDSGGNVEVSGKPPASEITSGREVISIRSRIAEERITFVRCANRPA